MLFLLWNLLCFGTPICNSAFSFNYTFIYSGVIKYDKCGIEEVWERRREKSNKGQGVGVLGLVTMVRKRYMWLEREFLCHIHGRWINFLFSLIFLMNLEQRICEMFSPNMVTFLKSYFHIKEINMVIILVLRFNRVSLAKILGLKLDCIFIGDMKLYANATKFKLLVIIL